jgi:hypothetical protein
VCGGCDPSPWRGPDQAVTTRTKCSASHTVVAWAVGKRRCQRMGRVTKYHGVRRRQWGHQWWCSIAGDLHYGTTTKPTQVPPHFPFLSFSSTFISQVLSLLSFLCSQLRVERDDGAVTVAQGRPWGLAATVQARPTMGIGCYCAG